MCGRFSQGREQTELEQRFGFQAPPGLISPRYNLAPRQECPLVIQEGGARALRLMNWGLLPAWAREQAGFKRPINARAETVASQPMFRQAFGRRRGLALADGFYEWAPAAPGQAKQPWYFFRADRAPFALAGLWESWTTPQGQPFLSFVIVTTAANSLLGRIHQRMPVILPPQAEAAWLDPGLDDPARLLPLLTPLPAAQMAGHPVSPEVNRPASQGEALTRPWAPLV